MTGLGQFRPSAGTPCQEGGHPLHLKPDGFGRSNRQGPPTYRSSQNATKALIHYVQVLGYNILSTNRHPKISFSPQIYHLRYYPNHRIYSLLLQTTRTSGFRREIPPQKKAKRIDDASQPTLQKSFHSLLIRCIQAVTRALCRCGQTRQKHNIATATATATVPMPTFNPTHQLQTSSEEMASNKRLIYNTSYVGWKIVHRIQTYLSHDHAGCRGVVSIHKKRLASIF